MREQLWFASLCGVLLLISGSEDCLAQLPGMPPGAGYPPAIGQMQGAYGPPGAYAYQSPYAGAHAAHPNGPQYYGQQGGYVVPAGAYMQGAAPSAAGQAAYPQTVTPWPAISPYLPQYSQTFMQDGSWFRESNSRNRRFFTSLEYLIGRARRPTGLVGNPDAQTYIELLRSLNNDDLEDILDAFGGDEDMNIDPLNYFDRLELTAFGDIATPGVRFKWGYTDPDDTGLTFTIWFARKLDDVFDASKLLAPGRGERREVLEQILRTPSPSDAIVNAPNPDPNDLLRVIPRDLLDLQPLFEPLDVQEILEENLLNLRGLPLDDGSLIRFDDGTIVGGVTVPYDLDYKVEISTETLGTSLNWLMTPAYKRNRLKIRPLVGVRYLQVREGMKFVGRDSGLVYDTGDADGLITDIKIHSVPNNFDENGDMIFDNAGTSEDDQGGGGGTVRFIQFRPTTQFPITSTLQHNITSHLFGPEIGLQYDLGGSFLKLSGQTKFGLMANYERYRLGGDNIAMITRDNTLLPVAPGNPNPNAFTDSEEHSHASPLFEQSIFIEMPLFRFIPIIKRMSLFREATFRAGYTYIHVREMARPSESTVWQGNPAIGLFPRISADRSKWSTYNWSFAVNWSW